MSVDKYLPDPPSSRASPLPQGFVLFEGSRSGAKPAIVAAIRFRGEHGLSTFCDADPGVFLQSDRRIPGRACR
ncbi:hypothetical protein EGJ55_01730 [Pseudomonas moraviensis]|nr:hypothetical protein EGJ55_01730 [Pseudomonas moraviensis]